MNSLKTIIFTVIIFLLNSAFVYPETYYISNSGSDANNGLSPVFPFKTIWKINSIINEIGPGDAILFERNGYFTGQINLKSGGSAGSPVFIGAYGKGKNPVISGAYPLRDWTLYKDNIYKTETDTVIKNLLYFREQMILARYPDKGFLTVKEPFANPRNGFTDGELRQTAGYWDNSNVRVRTVNWAYEYSRIKSFRNGQITFSDPFYYPVEEGWGYYLDNNLNELNSEKEWFFENSGGSKGTIYFKPPDRRIPENSLIEGSVFAYGIFAFSNLNNVNVSGLDFKNQTESGIFFSGNKSGIIIDNCTFSGQLMTGITLYDYSLNCTINNCRFYDINGKGIYILNSKNQTVSRCIFKNNGMIPGYGTKDDPFGMSGLIAMSSNSIHIFRNSFENTGHDAINCIGNSAVIENNIITNSMLFLNDGAAIKSYGENNSNSVWQNNFIFSVKGNTEGTPAGTELLASGTYLDAYCSNMKVLNNTITGCSLAAVFLYNECNNNAVSKNICYDNGTGIFFFKEKDPVSGNTVSGNIFFGINNNQYSVTLRAGSQGFLPGSFENNYYGSPFNSDLFVYQSGNLKQAFSYQGFQKILGNKFDPDPKILAGMEFTYPELLLNMNDDTAEVLLDPVYTYSIPGSGEINKRIKILPWSSQLIFSKSDLSKQPGIYIYGNRIDFGKISGGNISAPGWYKVFAYNTEQAITITAPDGFEVSTDDNIGYNKVISLKPDKGKIEKIVFVRFIPGSVKKYYGSITNTSGILKYDVKVSGDSE